MCQTIHFVNKVPIAKIQICVVIKDRYVFDANAPNWTFCQVISDPKY